MQLSILTLVLVLTGGAAVRGAEQAALPDPTARVDLAVDPLELLAGSAETWRTTSAQMNEHLKAMRPEWLDPEKMARIGNVRRQETAQLHVIMGGKLPVYETVVHFSDGLVQRVQISLFNRGDAGNLSVDEFKLLIDKAKMAISDQAGNPGQDRGKVTGAVLTKGWVWKNTVTQFLLESSLKRQQGEDRPEFLRLIIVPVAGGQRVALGSSASVGKSGATATLATLKANLKKEANGDVYIGNVPMVDQSQKGYCVGATAERVMRYFGAEVDQHEMAQMADSSSSRGTSPEKMTEALDKIDSKFNLRLKRVLPWTVRGYLDLIKDYNRVARSSKARQISELEALSVSDAYQEMDPETLKKSRATSGAMDKFRKVVHNYIDIGVPLIWGVHLGLYKEEVLPQSGGEHMRLIIGYNETSHEILFSDSWGSGHELKRINAEDAWSMTIVLYGMEPKTK